MAFGYVIGGGGGGSLDPTTENQPIYINSDDEAQECSTSETINITARDANKVNHALTFKDSSGTVVSFDGSADVSLAATGVSYANEANHTTNSISFKNYSGSVVSFNGSSALDLSSGTYQCNQATNADTVDGHHFNWSNTPGTAPTYMWGGNDSDNQYVYRPADLTVGAAASATDSTNATNADNVDGYHFNGTWQSGTPSYVWGWNEGVVAYPFSPSNFSVNYASSAGQATTSYKTYNAVGGAGSVELVRGNMADNDQFRILVGGTASNEGYVEFATADDASEPIYFRQYTGVFATPTRTVTLMDTSGYSTFIRAYNAVWNDYAEYREGTGTPGQCVCEDESGIVHPSTKRLQKCPNLISDTFGYIMGRSSDNDVALAVSGRVLAYTDKDRSKFKVGDVVCSGENGTVSKMNRLEILLFPDRILGKVSEIPTYETWGTGEVEVNNRIWIKVV